MIKIIGYTDADWAGDIEKRKSTSGFIFLLGNGAISWGSKKQACVALSTTEAEYVALSQATREAIWLQKLMCEFLQAPESKYHNPSRQPKLYGTSQESCVP